MRKQHMLHRLDKSKLSNSKYLNTKLLNKAFDPHNQYTLPYFWGTTGIIVNKQYWNPKTIQHWSDLWQPRFRNQLLIINDPREIFAVALIRLGYSINTRNPKQIKQAYLLIRRLMNNIKLFNTDAMTSIYIDEDATVGMVWSGEANLAKHENPNLRYIYPKEGFAIWIDCLAIPKFAPHIANAEKFINFLMRPNIAKIIMLKEGNASPNKAAIKLLSKKLQNNPIINPSNSVLSRGQYMLDVGKANSIYQKYWQLLKLGDGTSH